LAVTLWTTAALRAAYAVLQPSPTGESQYSDNGGYITDGTYSTSGWRGCAGWHEGTPEITLGLQHETVVSLIVVPLVGGGAGAAYFPARAAATLSLDGATWTAAGSTSARPDDSAGKARQAGVMAIRLEPPRPARFVRPALARRAVPGSRSHARRGQRRRVDAS
jgi:hypothetical protein